MSPIANPEPGPSMNNRLRGRAAADQVIATVDRAAIDLVIAEPTVVRIEVLTVRHARARRKLLRQHRRITKFARADRRDGKIDPDVPNRPTVVNASDLSVRQQSSDHQQNRDHRAPSTVSDVQRALQIVPPDQMTNLHPDWMRHPPLVSNLLLNAPSLLHNRGEGLFHRRGKSSMSLKVTCSRNRKSTKLQRVLKSLKAQMPTANPLSVSHDDVDVDADGAVVRDVKNQCAVRKKPKNRQRSRKSPNRPTMNLSRKRHRNLRKPVRMTNQKPTANDVVHADVVGAFDAVRTKWLHGPKSKQPRPLTPMIRTTRWN